MASWRVLEGGNLIYDGETFIGKMNTPAQAARVVRAVNYHDELVAALREQVANCNGSCGVCLRARDLLARIDTEEETQ